MELTAQKVKGDREKGPATALQPGTYALECRSRVRARSLVLFSLSPFPFWAVSSMNIVITSTPAHKYSLQCVRTCNNDSLRDMYIHVATSGYHSNTHMYAYLWVQLYLSQTACFGAPLIGHTCALFSVSAFTDRSHEPSLPTWNQKPLPPISLEVLQP